MTVHHLRISKKYEDIKILAQDLIADYPDVKDGIIIMFDENGAMMSYQCCTHSQMAFAGADLLVKSTMDKS